MRYLLLLLTALTLAACGTPQNTTRAQGDNSSITGPGKRGTERKLPSANAQDLTDYLSNIAGVTVRGRGPNASILIRGVKSISLTNEPLFVVDGTAAGNGLSSVYGAINVNDVDRIRVLKNSSDVAAYGSRGANGVIEIFTKK